jgi:hypothetical protein
MEETNSPTSSPVKKKKKDSSSNPVAVEKGAGVANKTAQEQEKEKKRKQSKKDKTKATPQPTSVLKTGKLGSGSRLSFADEAPKKKAPHDHKHKRVIVEINIDLMSDVLSQFESDNNKKAVYAIQQLVVNMMIADKFAVIHNADDLGMDATIGGAGGNAVPTNMTALSNFVKGFNPKPFANSTSYDPQGGQNRGRRQNNVIYGWIVISCDKEPEALTQQLSYEWSKFGNRICVKELQSGATSTSYIVWFVTTQCPKKVYIEEMRLITEMAIRALDNRDFFYDNKHLAKFSTEKLPPFTFRINIPKIPKHDDGGTMAKLPSFLQNNRKQLHLETAKEDAEIWEAIVDVAKQEGLFKQFWGKHCHVTEILTWESPHGDLKRGGKFTKKSTNFNISMTGTDIQGFLDLNDSIAVYDEKGNYICSFTGREVLCSFFKFQDGTPFIAAVHQIGPLSSAHIVHPNIPEGEVLATSFQKQPAVFIKGHLSDLNVDEDFIKRFLNTFVDAQLIHDIQNC